MPYKIVKRDGAEPYCVVKKDPSGEVIGDPLGCHATESDAKAQMAALYASEPGAKAIAVKMVDGAEDIIEGLGMPWGGPFATGQDLYGEHFTKSTDFALSWFPSDGGRPLLFHHSLDGDVGLSPVGRVKGYEVKADIGVWTRAQLDKSSEFFDAIKELVKAGKLFFSSGAMAHLVEVDKKSGEILKWPWVELSLTPTPANLLATVDFATAARHYKSAGLDLPEEIKAAGQSDRERLHAEADARAKKYGIAFKEKGGLTPPTGYPADEADYGDPVNYAYPIDESHLAAAVGYFNHEGQREAGGYTEAEWAVIGKRIAARAGEDYSYSGGKLQTPSNQPASKAVTMEQMKKIAADIGLEMTDAEMQKMVDAFPNHDEAAMRKALQTRKKMGKSAPDSLKAVSWQDVGDEVCKALDNRLMVANPFDMSMGGCVHIEETYSDRVIACVWMKCEERYFSVPFTLGPDGHVATVGDAVEMEETYVPKKLEQPLGTMAWTASRYAASFAERTKDLRQRRLKEGRMISDANRKRLMACMEQMMAACSEMQGLLDSSAPQPAKAAALRRLRAQLVAQQISVMTLN